MRNLNCTQRVAWWCLVALGLFASAASQAGPAPDSPFTHPDVIKAAVAMQLSETQQPVFRQAITEVANKQLATLAKLLKRRNPIDVPRKMRSKTKALMKQLDKKMAAILTAEQQPAYENYRKTLQAKMR